jgi:hypothetical protein
VTEGTTVTYVDIDARLASRAIDRDDVRARVEHFDRVARAGCDHEAVIWNSAVVLRSCDSCRGDTDFVAD